jgi:hypothetical protein
MPQAASWESSGAQAHHFRANPSNQTSGRDILSVEKCKHVSEIGLESVLSSALPAADKDLRQVADEVDELSKALKSETPDKQTAEVALHPAVWRAIISPREAPSDP